MPGHVDTCRSLYTGVLPGGEIVEKAGMAAGLLFASRERETPPNRGGFWGVETAG